MNEINCTDSEKKVELNMAKLTEIQVPVIDSSRLFGKGNEIMIRHDDAIYRLRITKNGKLIMSK